MSIAIVLDFLHDTFFPHFFDRFLKTKLLCLFKNRIIEFQTETIQTDKEHYKRLLLFLLDDRKSLTCFVFILFCFPKWKKEKEKKLPIIANWPDFWVGLGWVCVDETTQVNLSSLKNYFPQSIHFHIEL